MVTIKDEGIGIPSNLLNRITDPFFTTRKSEGGTGLGLAICSQIIKAHNGKIEVSSTIDKGSTFKIVLPVQNSEGPVDTSLSFRQEI